LLGNLAIYIKKAEFSRFKGIFRLKKILNVILLVIVDLDILLAGIMAIRPESKVV